MNFICFNVKPIVLIITARFHSTHSQERVLGMTRIGPYLERSFSPGSYCHVLIAKMAAPIAGLAMCDSSDEETVAVFVCVAGVARRQRKTKKKTRHAARFVWYNQ